MDRVTKARLVVVEAVIEAVVEAVVEPVVTAAVETAMRRSSEREGVRARGQQNGHARAWDAVPVTESKKWCGGEWELM
jgi:hypothetical protein